MSRVTNPRQIVFAVSLMVWAVLAETGAAAAQTGGRMRVLVPDFSSAQGAKSKSGEKLAEELRRQINALATHAAVDTNDKPVKDAIRNFGLKESDMDCITWLQLAAQKAVAQLVLCGDVDAATGKVTARFTPIGGGEPFEVPEFTMQTPEQGAQQIVQSFNTYIQQLNLAVFCDDHSKSHSWQQALDACTQALALNPKASALQYARGAALRELDRNEEALAAFKKVLELDPISTDALLSAGLLAATLGQQDMSQQHFHEYLALNPGDEAVRLSVAIELAKAGDPAGALKLMEELTSKAGASTVVYRYAGFFAGNAALMIMQQTDRGTDEQRTREAAPLFHKAIAHLERSIQLQPDSVDPTVLRQLMLSYRGVANTDKAVDVGRRATARDADAQTWSVFAEVLKDAKLMDEAIRALQRAAQLDPTLPNHAARSAALLFEMDRLDEATATVKAALANHTIDPQIAETLAQRMAVRAYQLTQSSQFDRAVAYLRAGREIAQAAPTVALINYFDAYNLIRQAAPVLQNPNATAAQAARVKPMFERAKTLLESATAVPADQAATRTTLIAQAIQFIEVADAIIRTKR